MPNDLAVLAAHDRIIRKQADLIYAMEYLVYVLRDGPVKERSVRFTARWRGIPESALDDACRRFAVQSYVVDGTSWWTLKSDTEGAAP